MGKKKGKKPNGAKREESEEGQDLYLEVTSQFLTGQSNTEQ